MTVVESVNTKFPPAILVESSDVLVPLRDGLGSRGGGLQPSSP